MCRTTGRVHVNPAGLTVYIMPMFRKLFPALALSSLMGPLALGAQSPVTGRCATPDSVAVEGNHRVNVVTIRQTSGLIPGASLSYRFIQQSIRDLFSTGQFDAVDLDCALSPAGDFALLTIKVHERPLLSGVEITGTQALSERTVRDHLSLPTEKPLDPAAVSKSIFLIDSTYEKSGYYLAHVRADTTRVDSEHVQLVLHVDEGHHVALSGMRVQGNSHVPATDIAHAMKTRPEGFFWWTRGDLSDDVLSADLSDRIPKLFADRGFLDFRVEQDSLVVDRARGKALLDLKVDEGPRYRVGDFEVVGSRHFSNEELHQFYPFEDQSRPLASRISDFIRRRSPVPLDAFNQEKWDDATNQVRTAYNNDGYIYASVRPVVERHVSKDSVSYVDLRWEVDEQTPAIINRIDIVGNDFTSESCIRDQLVILPGDVFNQDRLIKSWQSISQLGFFETPLPPPDTHQANEQGDVDVIFHVKEKRTGNVNFGASMGQGTGIGGFIGLDQPNLFGQCKRGSLQWQFGKYLNDFNLTYTDPRIRQSMISGTVTLYRRLSRYYIADLGRSLSLGAQLQIGLPIRWDPWSRLFITYGGESVKYGDNGLLGAVATQYGTRSIRSSMGLTFTRDTRFGTPFPTSGTMQSIAATFTGGPLGGSASFQRYTTDLSAYAPLAEIGDRGPGKSPMVLVAGISSRAGAVFGNTGPFFYSQEFAMGGVQYGERLRGYEEFSITPDGYVTGTNAYNAQRTSFGKAFFSTTAELGLRMNQSLYVDMFYDAGNVWRRAREIDPTRLFRGVGIGASIVSPLGPLGLDYAYGLDRLNDAGLRAPKWQLHFRFGQLF